MAAIAVASSIDQVAAESNPCAVFHQPGSAGQVRWRIQSESSIRYRPLRCGLTFGEWVRINARTAASMAAIDEDFQIVSLGHRESPSWFFSQR